MYFSDVTKFGLPIDYYILDLEFGSTRAADSQQDVPLEIALTQYHKGQQKHKAFLKYCLQIHCLCRKQKTPSFAHFSVIAKTRL